VRWNNEINGGIPTIFCKIILWTQTNYDNFSKNYTKKCIMRSDLSPMFGQAEILECEL
jgi:hypothetical protein